MRLCTFARPPVEAPTGTTPESRPLAGGLHLEKPDQVIDLSAAARHPAVRAAWTPPPALEARLESLITLLEGGWEMLMATRTLLETVCRLDLPELEHPLARLRLLAPLPRPRSIRDCMAFEGHYLQALRGGARLKFPAIAGLDRILRQTVRLPLIRTPRLFRELPVYYKGNPASVVGHESDVRWPTYSELLDYELEVGLYLCQTLRDCPPARALEAVAGYTIFNDFSARDTQLREMELRLGPAKGKDFDTGNVMGPFLVTRDEVPDLRALKARAFLNGRLVTDSSLETLQFGVEEILAYISQSETLHPGEFIGLGTVPNGCGLEHGTWLQPGDEVELEVTGLGKLRNRVVQSPPLAPVT